MGLEQRLKRASSTAATGCTVIARRFKHTTSNYSVWVLYSVGPPGSNRCGRASMRMRAEQVTADTWDREVAGTKVTRTGIVRTGV